jgi:hypothetical protein
VGAVLFAAAGKVFLPDGPREMRPGGNLGKSSFFCTEGVKMPHFFFMCMILLRYLEKRPFFSCNPGRRFVTFAKTKLQMVHAVTSGFTQHDLPAPSSR